MTEEIDSLRELINKEFISRLTNQVGIRPSPVGPWDFPELDWSGRSYASGLSYGLSKETQLGFYDLQIPCATVNSRHDRRLSLVLDLDQTLVHAMKIRELFGDVYKPNGRTMTDTESFLLNQMVEVENPMLVDSFTSRLEFSAPSMVSPITGYVPEPRQLLVTRLDGEIYLIKLRPGLRQFIEELAKVYELHIYTKANRNYLNFLLYELDPVGKLFTSAVARDDSPDLDTDLKILNRVCCRDMREVVVFDDRVDVWNETPANVVRAQPYNFLTLKKLAVVKALEEIVSVSQDPNAMNSATALDFDCHLYYMKEVLLKIFEGYVNAGEKTPVPDIISLHRKETLSGMKIQFSGFPDMIAHVKDAEEYGAISSSPQAEDSDNDPQTILVAARHTKRVYDAKKENIKSKIVHWCWMEHVRSTWQKPSLSVFDISRFRMDESGGYGAMDNWEVAWIAASADSTSSDRASSNKRRKKESTV